MTGFARCEAGSTFGTLVWEIRSVNHRYLDLHLRLPEELRSFETRLRQQIGASIARGKIDCGLYLKRSDPAATELQLNRDVLEKLGDVLERLDTLVSGLAPANPLEVLRWPGVIEEAPIEPEVLVERAAALLDDALAALTRMRQREGERLKTMLLERCDGIDTIAATVRARREAVTEAIRTRMHERLERLTAEVDPARMEAEIALLLQKLDVDEELDRLGSHLTEVRSVLGRADAIGRRLDFLMQELNREANTLASKAADAETTRSAVDLKVLIEQMREQVQNVE